QRLSELGFRRIGEIEMQRMLVHRQQREPGVVGLADGAARAMLVDLADGEVLVVAAVAFAQPVLTDGFGGCDHGVPVYAALVSPRTGPSTASECSPSAGVCSEGAGGSWRKRMTGAIWRRPS